MRIAGVDFPEKILQALNDEKLVIFVGAGVSIPPPSNYPSSKQLANKLNNDVLEFENGEPIDRFLGRLQDEGVAVHKKTNQILSDQTSQPNSLHRHLISLFPNEKSLRIVTTNFDRHLETIAKERWGKDRLEIYSAPALPLGDRFNGIVYLHGCVGNNPDHLVLTDRDFGRAYLTEGWAMRFLMAMFNKFTVLFIGYRHEDLDMTYLSRALPTEAQENRYALTPKGRNERWRFWGIITIEYDQLGGSGDHTELEKALQQWATFEQRGALDHENKIKEIITLTEISPSKELNLTPDDEDYLLYCLQDIIMARYFMRYASDPTWLLWIEKKGFLKPLFKPNEPCDEISYDLSLWFEEKFVCQHPDVAIGVVQRNGPRLNSVLWTQIAGILSISKKNKNNDSSLTDPQVFAKWVAILCRSPEPEPHGEYLDYLLKDCEIPDDTDLALILFDYLTMPRLQLRPMFSSTSENGELEWSTRYEVSIRGGQHWLNEIWRNLFKLHLDIFADRLEPVLTHHLKHAHYLLRSVGGANSKWDPESFRRSAIEPHPQDKTMPPHKIDILIYAARDVIEHLLTIDLKKAHCIIESWGASEVPLLQRLAIHGIIQSNYLKPDDKISWVIDHGWMFHSSVKHEIFNLLKIAYPSTSRDTRILLLNTAEDYRKEGQMNDGQ